GAGLRLYRDAEGDVDPQGGDHGDGQSQHTADGEGDIGLNKGAGFGPADDLCLYGFLGADGGDGRTDIGQLGHLSDLGQSLAASGRIASLSHSRLSLLLKGGGRSANLRLLLPIDALDVRSRQI